MEAFADFLDRMMGRRTVPLSYVIRKDAVVPAIAPPLAAFPHVCFDNDLRRSVDEIRSRSTSSFLNIDFLQSTYPKMVFTVNQTIAFYEYNDQMYLPQSTRLQLVNEGLEHVHDLLEFD